MMKKLRKLLREDVAESNLVAAVFLVPFVVVSAATAIDGVLLMQNRSLLETKARDGARTVAILGGNGSTPIQREQGLDPNFDKSSLEGEVKNTSPAQTNVKQVRCTPEITKKLGDPVECAITFSYKHLPLSLFSLFMGGEETTVYGTARSEVGYGP